MKRCSSQVYSMRSFERCFHFKRRPDELETRKAVLKTSLYLLGCAAKPHDLDQLYSTSWSNAFDVLLQKEIEDKSTSTSSSSSSKLALIVGICVASIIVFIIIAVIIYKSSICRKESPPRREITEVNYKKTMDVSNYEDLTDKNVCADTYEEMGNVSNAYEQIPMRKVQREKMSTSEFSNFFMHELGCNYEQLKKEINSLIPKFDCSSPHYDNAVDKIVEIPSSNEHLVGYSIFQEMDINDSSNVWKKIFLQKLEIVVVVRCYGVLRSQKLLNCQIGEVVKHGEYDVRLCQMKVLKDHTIQEVEINYGKHEHKLWLYEFEVLPLEEYVASTEYLMNTCRALSEMIQNAKITHISFIDNSGYRFDIILITIIEMMALIKEKGTVDIYNLFAMIVSKTPLLNVGFNQYCIIHKVIWEVITYGKKYVTVENFQKEYRNLKLHKDNKGRYLFEREFAEQVELQRSTAITFNAASIPCNSSKNRFQGILAGDNSRVVLSQPADYINAVYVDSYQRRNAYITTQAPLEETVLDFWNMVVQENVTTIVMLYTFNEEEDVGSMDYPVFWSIPRNNSKETMVKLISEMAYGVLVCRSIQVLVQKKTHIVNILQLTNWSPKNLPKVGDVKLVVEELEKSQERLDYGRIVVTCSDGAYRSGTFIACMNALEQMKLDNGVDVFNIVRCMRQSRPEFILNEHQYIFPYEVVNSFVENLSAKDNINA
ncbi:receptor-type tyrosine-protein phosphatase F-like [Hydractinia symbiolongicarpus]|uniref:receptor-type tyrosine-protein phosphatase F-like n=1 Tax=Hydractinia symbiolongicarpus TaxID=13093 RepID=UPI00254D6239|nr:receptor-type tyrosine-protein phosphatase F-like [Hydractinia symbiolongicarpus]